VVEGRLQEIDDITQFARRTGRAELDEHAEGVNNTEYIIELDPASLRSRDEQLDEIRHAMEEIPGIVTAVEQPIAHLISHMLSGVKAAIGIKIYGDDLDVLRRKAEQVKADMEGIAGVKDLLIEPQVIIPQLRIELDRDKLQLYGLSVAAVNEFIETAMSGDVVSEVLIGQRTFDLVVRLDDDYREDLEVLRRLSIELPEGGRVPLEAVARIYESGGPNTVNREKVRRRVVIQCNVSDRGVVDVVHDIQERLAPLVASLPPGYSVEYGGQFESQQSASRLIGALFVVSLVGVFLVLFTMFRSVNLSLQVMAALPMAFIGSVAALVLTGQTLTIAAMVGFISLAGIASRNGILLLNHYLHLVQYEREDWTKEMIVRAGLERLAPVLMTALTAGIGLVPLVLAADEPGKEILYPVATVILGGLISSTLLDFFVHPALFWLFGINEAARVVGQARERIEFVEHDVALRAGMEDAPDNPERLLH
jgi:Cu/Ag efflux pump CusA